jgi:hypothetical protein
MLDGKVLLMKPPKNKHISKARQQSIVDNDSAVTSTQALQVFKDKLHLWQSASANGLTDLGLGQVV